MACTQGIGNRMISTTVRSAGLAVLLTMSGCGLLGSSDLGTRQPGLSVAEAARIEGCTIPTIYWRVHQARKLLKQRLEPLLNHDS